MPKYNINRKYTLPERFEMLDLGVAEDERDPIEILNELDKIYEEYIKQYEKPDEPFPDKGRNATEDYLANK